MTVHLPERALALREPLSQRAPIVAIRGLTKLFPVRRSLLDLVRHGFREEKATVVRSVTCDIHHGECFGLLGPNGAGKTTLFKMLSTLVLPDEGTATVAGYDILTQPAAVRRVLAPVIADERSLSWRLSARENLNLFGRLYGWRGRELRSRVDEILQVVELADTGQKMVGQFSSGMKQRLLIARALLARPQVLLLDEPTRSLDPLSARRLRAFLREEIIHRQGCTVLLATHNSEEALELCTRVGVLYGGRLLAVGTAEELAARIRGSRYRIWTLSPDDPLFARLASQGCIRQIAIEPPESDGWTPTEIEVYGDTERIAEVLRTLVREGVPVARCEKVKPVLADLIEEIAEIPLRGDRNG